VSFQRKTVNGFYEKPKMLVRSAAANCVFDSFPLKNTAFILIKIDTKQVLKKSARYLTFTISQQV